MADTHQQPDPRPDEHTPLSKPRTDAGATMLSGSLWKAIPLFALPVAATSILEQLSNLIGIVVI
ncbi:MAG: hypothetical protein KHY83_01940, partial [Coriobacteriia bacterium]|nr:hypothetical protein [Coriobacteriia bacterium]